MASSVIKRHSATFVLLKAINDADLNDIQISGFYTGDNLIHAPEDASDHFIIEHFNFDNNSDYSIQIAHRINIGNEVFKRKKERTWGSWRKFSTTS